MSRPPTVNPKLAKAALSKGLFTFPDPGWAPIFLDLQMFLQSKLLHASGASYCLTMMLEATTVGSSHTDSMKNAWWE